MTNEMNDKLKDVVSQFDEVLNEIENKVNCFIDVIQVDKLNSIRNSIQQIYEGE